MASDNQNQSQKVFCSKCYKSLNEEDKINIEGQSFHKNCSMCCICRNIPSSLKIYNGHVFCNECFKSCVSHWLKGDNYYNNNLYNGLWMQWCPFRNPCCSHWETPTKNPGEGDKNDSSNKYVCIRCLKPIEEGNKISIDSRNYHIDCAKCSMCNTLPNSLKIYYGEVFCENCFHQHIMNSNKNNSCGFYKSCFEQWQSNSHFSEFINQFMSSGGQNRPIIVMQVPPPFCRCSSNNSDWCTSEPNKSVATKARVPSKSEYSNINFKTDISQSSKNILPECEDMRHLSLTDTVEKIEKLSKLLQKVSNEKCNKKWKDFIDVQQK